MRLHAGILAGGRSSRFGRNKALFKFHGVTLLSRVIMEVSRHPGKVDTVLVSVHDEKQLQETRSYLEGELGIIETPDHSWLYDPGSGEEERPALRIRFVLDAVPEFLGNARSPIIGIKSILDSAGDGIIQLVPCDTPFFTARVMNDLLSTCLDHGSDWDACIPRWSNGYIEPLHGVYQVSFFRKKVKETIDSGELKVRAALEHDFRIIFYEIETRLGLLGEGPDVFYNINTGDDLP